MANTLLTITQELLDNIDIIADYYDIDNDIALNRIIVDELKRITPLLEAKRALKMADNMEEDGGLQIISAGDLEKGKPVEGEFAGEKIWERNWRRVLIQVLTILYKKINVSRSDFVTKIPSVTNINIADGLRDDSGYVPIKELGISFQSPSAPRAGEFIRKVAEHYQVSFRFKVRWGSLGDKLGSFESELRN